MSTPPDIYDPLAHQERNAVPAGQDLVENTDHFDNLGDADTLADLDGPEPKDGPILTPYLDDAQTDDPLSPSADDPRDEQTDGDRPLTTDSDALDGGLNDSDLGADVAGLGPDVAPPPGGGTASGGGTGLGAGLRE